MNQEIDNIYSPPGANLEPPSKGLSDLPRLSTWWVLLFTVITVYVYAIYWLYSRTKILNRIFPEDPVPAFLWIGCPIIWLGSVVVEMSDIFFELGLGSEHWSQPIDLVSGLIVLIWAFSIRNRLTKLFLVSQSGLEIGPFMTFFLSPYYLAYKINEAKDGAGLST